MTDFNKLPVDVQNEIKDTLQVYDKTNVIFEYGKFHVSSGIALKKTYGDDHEFIGTYYAKDVFTDDERIVNYVNNFYSFPIEYKGKRDYSIFRTGKREEFVLINGNIEIKK